mmetsp:Transcript_20016/g.57462  ORF Transcript_20016/g.57462 Transcript_20016/m.57462 type:complete len:1210 (-) Transcript_20016:1521-5150(-)
MMRTISSFATNGLVLLPALVAVAAATTNTTNSTRPTHLQLDDFDRLLSTEALYEFGVRHHPAIGVDGYNAAIDYEWDRAERIEAAHDNRQRRLMTTTATTTTRRRGSADELHASNHEGGVAPFVVCDPSRNKNGHACRSTIEGLFGDDTMMALSNEQDMTCYYVSSTSSRAESVPSSLVVSPLLPEMKMQEGLFDSIDKEESEPFHLYSMLCPGHSSSKEEARLITLNIVESVHETYTGEWEGDRHLVADEFLRFGRSSSPSSSISSPSNNGEISPSTNTRYVRERAPTNNDRRLRWSRSLQDAIGSQECASALSLIAVDATSDGQTSFIDLPDGITTSCLHTLVAALSIASQVCSIGLVPEVQATNLEAQWITQSGITEERPFFDVRLTGKDQVVAVSDSGLDVDSCYFINDGGDIRKDGSVDMSQRKVVQYVPYADSSDYRGGHGTHVVGTVLGHRSDDGQSERDGAANGVAKDAKVAFFDIGRGSNGYLSTPRDKAGLLNYGRRAGARIHSASWGSEFSGYGIDEYYFDQYLHSNDDFLLVVAAGNSGPSRGSIGSPATSKNCLTVGASQSAGNDITSNMDGPEYLARFSSRGPTRDGRTKPEVVAPGFYIKSAGAQPTRRGECDDTNGVHYLKGTSMSAPVVSGSAAIIREYFMSGFYPSGTMNPSDAMEPSGVLVKAVILNGAVSLLGAEGQWWSRTTDDVELYDDNQNFGRLNLLNSLPLKGRNTISAKIIDRKTIQNGRTDEYIIEIDRSNGCDAFELSATLVWNDPASPPNCRSCLMNDLDLTMSSGSTTVYANGRDDRDTLNNSERVRVAAADGDRFVVRVEARNLETPTQKYALAITGCLADGTDTNSGSTVATNPTPVPAPTPAVVVPVPTAPTPPAGNGDDSQSLTTTTQGTITYYGNMFNIDAGTKDILIKSLGIHTSSTAQVSVQIFSKGGSLVGSHRSSSGWVRIVSTTVQGRGAGAITPIPPTAFATAVSVGAGTTQAFYVTLDTEELLISDGRNFGLAVAANTDLTIDEGTANTYRFGTFFYPYVWNGAITYARLDEDSITTTFETDANYLGCMFDVTAKQNNVIIAGMDFHSSSTSRANIEIWTRPGTYVGHADSASGWTKITEGSVVGLGRSSRTHIPSDIFQSTTIAAGSTTAFYVSYTSSDAMLYNRQGDAMSNNDIIISTGAALNYPFNDVYQDRTWNGVLRYKRVQ